MSYFTDTPFVKELSPSDFQGKRPKEVGCAAVLFYADWCPHCKSIKDDWIKLGKMASFIKIMAFNCADPSNKEYLSNLDFIQGYPTIVLYSGKGSPRGESMTIYQGERKFDNLLKSCMNYCVGK